MVWPMRLPRPAQAQPRCVSRICPTFMRDGTPSGLSTMSAWVPSSRNGMSSIGTILDTTPFFSVPAGHLVAGLDLALHRDEDFHHLHHAGRQFVAALQLFDLVEEALFEALLRFVVLLPHRLDFGHQLVVGGCEHPPLRPRMLVEHGSRDLGVFLETL